MCGTSPNLYDNVRLYDIFIGELPTQTELDFYNTLISRYHEPVLELACGTGRITIPLARLGFKIQGLDLSLEMLERARHKAREVNLDIPFHNFDMRNFALDQKFGLIFIPHQSFQHLYTRQDVESCLNSVRRHLLPDGAFLIQVFNPSLRLLAIDSQTRMKTSRDYYIDNQSGTCYFVEIQNKYHSDLQVIEATYFYHTDSDPTERIFKLNLRQFFPQELDALLEYNGFEIAAKYGDEQFTPFEQKPYYQNVLCRLK